MTDPDTTTCWTLIHLAAEGSQEHRNTFGQRYLPLVRAYFGHRWRGWPIAREVNDAAQDVFVECFRDGGVLARAQPEEGAFQAFLLGTAKNVARRYEERVVESREQSPDQTAFLQNQPSRETQYSTFFDRRWAESIMADARQLMERKAIEEGADARRRLEIMQLHFDDDLPMREIAARWGEEPRQIHDAFARARREFYRCLRDTVALHGGGDGKAIETECRKLLQMLG